MTRARVFAVCLLIFFSLSACALLTGPGRKLHIADCYFRDQKYAEAARMYRRVLREYPRSSLAASARFDLAYTLAFYDNPHKDYGQALQEFDEFIKTYPDDERVEDAQNFQYIIKTLYETKKNNERLNKSIEQLRRLDIRHEQKRAKDKYKYR